MKRSLLLMLVCLLGVCSAEAALESVYCNARFGFCLSCPDGFEMDPPPTNDDGRIFRDQNGCILTAWGGYNALGETLAEALTSQSANFDTVTYKTKGKNWFVLSGYKGSDIVYLKLWVGSDAINGLRIEYPSSMKKKYDAVVTKIVRSFRPGAL